VREAVPGLALFGGIVLNYAVGGLNPQAVESALRAGAIEVWMPTHCAERERSFRGRAGTGISIHDDHGCLRAEVYDILALVAEANAMLGTVHLAPVEIRALVRAAREAGVKKILITHPEIEFVNVPPELEYELAAPDLWFERCYVRRGFVRNWDELAQAIRATGIDRNVLATDLGQPENPDPISGLAEMRARLHERGFSDAELRRMMCDTPAHLLGLT
jgi:hypothetical protein